MVSLIKEIIHFQLDSHIHTFNGKDQPSRVSFIIVGIKPVSPTNIIAGSGITLTVGIVLIAKKDLLHERCIMHFPECKGM